MSLGPIIRTVVTQAYKKAFQAFSKSKVEVVSQETFKKMTRENFNRTIKEVEAAKEKVSMKTDSSSKQLP